MIAGQLVFAIVFLLGFLILNKLRPNKKNGIFALISAFIISIIAYAYPSLDNFFINLLGSSLASTIGLVLWAVIIIEIAFVLYLIFLKFSI